MPDERLSRIPRNARIPNERPFAEAFGSSLAWRCWLFACACRWSISAGFMRVRFGMSSLARSSGIPSMWIRNSCCSRTSP